ncbi:hypothetical protein [Dongia sedimenti]|uniref:Uncharacterized protein n=1 Tax=Dongia sedimenti TaxID=3064282 RepID=A0ABU0YSN8_9PROT|nr:hypothetical protein [Rhodospirillaceae bacterium R-7]
MNRDVESPRGKHASIAVASALLLTAFLVPVAYGQTKEPEKPADFKAMEAPGGNAPLTTAPGASLITPATGPVNPRPGFTGSKMVMTQAVWRDYVRYLQNDAAIGYGLFMITVDGASSDVKACKNYACQISPVTRSTALSECQAKLRNRRCVVFAEGRDIKYAYQVVP